LRFFRRAVAARALVTAALAVFAGVGGAASAPASVSVAASRPTVLFHLTDPRIDEASGIAAGIESPGVLYVQNDSGDEARFFAIDGSTGRTLATYAVPGASNIDWEDIAVAPDRRGRPSVWLADIGDNAAARGEIAIYRVDEPQVDRNRTDVAAGTSAPEVWRLRYPGGPADAESLAVSPGGAAYVLTKSLTGNSQIFAVPPRPDALRVQMLRAIGKVRFGLTGTPGGPSRFGQLTATAAALSRGGSILAVRTYTDAYLWRVRGGDVAAAVQRHPVRVALPAQPQGEGLAIDGSRLLIDSEGAGSAVYAVALPSAIFSATPNPSASPSPRSASGVGVPGPAVTTPAGGSRHYSGATQIGAVVLLVAMVVLTAYLMRRIRGGR
jgi:hypothetical protein